MNPKGNENPSTAIIKVALLSLTLTEDVTHITVVLLLCK